LTEILKIGFVLSGEKAALTEDDELVRDYMKRNPSKEAVVCEVPVDAVNSILRVGGLTEEEKRMDRALKKKLRESMEHRALGARNTMRRRGRRRLHKGQLK